MYTPNNLMMLKTFGGSGNGSRIGITLIELFEMFSNDSTAELWLENARWAIDGADCPRCNSRDRVKEAPNQKPAAYWCASSRKHFNVRTGTVLADTKISYQIWAIAKYLHATSLKGASSMKLHKDLGNTQKSGWHLSHRLREAMTSVQITFDRPVEVD